VGVNLLRDLIGLFFGQLNVQGAEIGQLVFSARRFWNHAAAACHSPCQNHLSHALAVLLSKFENVGVLVARERKSFLLENWIAHAAERAPGNRADAN